MQRSQSQQVCVRLILIGLVDQTLGISPPRERLRYECPHKVKDCVFHSELRPAMLFQTVQETRDVGVHAPWDTFENTRRHIVHQRIHLSQRKQPTGVETTQTKRFQVALHAHNPLRLRRGPRKMLSYAITLTQRLNRIPLGLPIFRLLSLSFLTRLQFHCRRRITKQL